MYRTIESEFWTDPTTRRLKKEARYLFLYLITNPHSHLCGLYNLSLLVMGDETGLGRGVEGVLAELVAANLVVYDKIYAQVWVRNMLDYQGRGQNIEKNVAEHLRGLHKSPLIRLFLERYPKIALKLSNEFLSQIEYPSEPPSQGESDFPSPGPGPGPSSGPEEEESEKESGNGRGKLRARAEQLDALEAFVVSERTREWARQELGVEIPEDVVHEFKDHWRGQKRLRSDWEATFRNRIRQLVGWKILRKNAAVASRPRTVAELL